tara:strand:- start:618 stop:1691 length:1074 start_codon:yes stop_codon:yes gene_type:complete
MRDATQSFGAFRQVPLLYSEPPRRGIIEKFEANADGTQPLEEQLRPLGPDTGRGSDEYLAHLNAREVALLDAITKGGGSINPTTGLMEFEDDDGDSEGDDAAGMGDNADDNTAEDEDDDDGGFDDDDDSIGGNIAEDVGQEDSPDFAIDQGTGITSFGGFLSSYGDNPDQMSTYSEEQGPGFSPTLNEDGVAVGYGTSLFSQMGSFIKGSLKGLANNPISSLFNLALNMNPIGLGVNLASGLITGKSVPGNIGELFNQPANPSPFNVALGQVGQDIAGTFAPTVVSQNDPSVAFDPEGQVAYADLLAEIEAGDYLTDFYNKNDQTNTDLGPVETDLGPVETDFFGGFDNTSTAAPRR